MQFYLYEFCPLCFAKKFFFCVNKYIYVVYENGFLLTIMEVISDTHMRVACYP
jgi:hypothetical protein